VVAAHHAQIPSTGSHRGKARLHLKGRAPEVEVRSLSVYEALVAPEEAA
jgi:hypothetical protein